MRAHRRPGFSNIAVRSGVLVVLLFGACSRPPATGRIGRVDAMRGEVVLLHDGERRAAAVGAAIAAGDRLETGPAGKVQVTLTDHSVVAIGPRTVIELSEMLVDGTARTGRIEVTAGRFWVHVNKWTKGSSVYEIATPNAVAGVRGTTLWGDTEVDAICALEGTIEVRSLRQSDLAPVTLTSGSCASQLSQGKLEPLAPDKDQLRRYLDDVLLPNAPRATR